MNTAPAKLLSVFLSAILFTILFYRQNIGLNLLLFEFTIIGLLFYDKRIDKTPESVLTVSGTILTAIMVVIHNSILAIVVNWMSLFLMTSVLLFPKVRALTSSLAIGIVHAVVSQLEFFKLLSRAKGSNKSMSLLFRWIRILAIPLVILFVFIAIYSAANPVFDGMLSGITERLNALLDVIFSRIQFGMFMFFILGMIVSDFLLLRTVDKGISEAGTKASDDLIRKRHRFYASNLSQSLKTELRSGVFLLVILNLLLFLVNAIDIHWVWFNFEWNGEYLKQFVHEGTFLLIVSIFISIVISIYLFRGNQNFFSKSGWLKRLTVLWLFQNAILAVSVCIRNMHYIEYYALAHKRIGVFFFLLATIIGLAIVIIKIRKKKTLHYVLRTNAISVYTILVVMTFVNWDVVIVKYNFKHFETTFTHLDFLWNLNYATLPYQPTDSEVLEEVENSNSRFPSSIEYLSGSRYTVKVSDRKKQFMQDWETRDWRSWNWAYARTYKQLKAAD